jgi:hypothetical protein
MLDFNTAINSILIDLLYISLSFLWQIILESFNNVELVQGFNRSETNYTPVGLLTPHRSSFSGSQKKLFFDNYINSYSTSEISY